MIDVTQAETYSHDISEISPETADLWLERQFEGQRKKREHHVLMLAQEMENGSFIPHSSIVFAEVGGKEYLIDGQHRLAAISLLGKSVSMPVLRKRATTLEQVREWYASIDQGLKRTARDAIRAQGLSSELQLSERQAGRLSGAVKLIATGFMDMTSGISAPAKVNRAKSRSNAAVSRLMRSWAPEAKVYFDSVSGGEHSNMYLFDRAPIIACGVLTVRHMTEKAVEFWSEMASDDGLSKSDPRKRFLVWLRDGKHRQGDVARGFSIAWKAYLEARDVTLIRLGDRSKAIEFKGIPLDKEIAAAHDLVVLGEHLAAPSFDHEPATE